MIELTANELNEINGGDGLYIPTPANLQYSGAQLVDYGSQMIDNSQATGNYGAYLGGFVVAGLGVAMDLSGAFFGAL